MRMSQKLAYLWLLISLSITVVHAHANSDEHEETADDGSSHSRLLWHMMDLTPYEPPIPPPEGIGVSELQVTGRILAAASCMLEPIELSEDFTEVIESAKVDNGWPINGEGNDWNNDSAIESWVFTKGSTDPENIDPTIGFAEFTVSDCGTTCSKFYDRIKDNVDINKGKATVKIYSNSQRVIVAFLGTDKDFGDVYNDLNVAPKNFRGVYFHRGFVEYYLALRAKVIEQLDVYDAANKRVYFTGHSLGAATATIAIYDYALNTNYKDVLYRPTLHTIAPPAAVHCTRPKRWVGIGPFRTQVTDKCDPLLDGNVLKYEATRIRTVDAAGTEKTSPLLRHLHYWVNVRDLAPFIWTPKKESAWPYPNPQYAQVGALHEMNLLADSNVQSGETPWTINTYRGPKWSQNPATFLGKLKVLLQLTDFRVAYHDQNHYASGLERRSKNPQRWWSHLYGKDDKSQSIFDAIGDSGEQKCGDKGTYHNDIKPGALATTTASSSGSAISAQSNVSEASSDTGSSGPFMLLSIAAWLVLFRIRQSK